MIPFATDRAVSRGGRTGRPPMAPHPWGPASGGKGTAMMKTKVGLIPNKRLQGSGQIVFGVLLSEVRPWGGSRGGLRGGHRWGHEMEWGGIQCSANWQITRQISNYSASWRTGSSDGEKFHIKLFLKSLNDWKSVLITWMKLNYELSLPSIGLKLIINYTFTTKYRRLKGFAK